MAHSNDDLLKAFLLANGINNASTTTMLREYLETGGGTPSVSWDDVTDKPTFSTVATSGSYEDLTNTPVLGTAASADTGDFATAAQGTLADSALQSGASASDIQVAEYVTGGITAGDLQTVLNALADRITALEP